jgi:flavin-binding protein dodecin
MRPLQHRLDRALLDFKLLTMRRADMSIAKVIEISSSSPKGIEHAIQDGLKRASKTINNIKGAWINDIKVVTDDTGKVTDWRVNMRINFVLD